MNIPAGQRLFYFCCVYFPVTSMLFFVNRKNFPITQRLPHWVTIEVIFIFGEVLVNLHAIAFPDNTLNCSLWNVLGTVFANIPTAIVSFRITYLINKSVITKLIVGNQHLYAAGSGLRTKEGESAVKLMKTLPFEIIERLVIKLLTKFGPTWGSALQVSPAILLQIIDAIIRFTTWASLPQYGVLPVTSDSCLDDFISPTKSKMGAIVYGYLGLLSLFGGAAVFRMKDAMSIHIELKALFVVIGGIVASSLIFNISDGAWIDTLYLFCLLSSIVSGALVFVQTTFPLIICYMKMYRFSGERVLYRSVSDQKSSIPPSSPSAANAPKKGQTLQVAIDSMMRIIHFPETRDAFMKFLESEVAVENLLFLEACERFERSIEQGKSDKELIQSMMENFIVATAPSCVNLPYQTRDLIVLKFDEMMKNVDSPIDPELFKVAKKNIINLLVTDSFRRFQLSPEFTEPGITEVKTNPEVVQIA
jgi:hypothetical protein